MKILFLNSAREWGGNEKWTIEAACGLAQRGHEVFLGCRSRVFEEKAWCEKLRFVKIPFSNNLDLYTLLKIRSFIRKNGIEILVPTKQREYFLGGLAAAGIPSVKVAARLGIERPVRNFRNKTAFCSLFDSVIVNSQKIIETLGQTPSFDTSKCALVYNGVKIPELSVRIREEYRSLLGITGENRLIIGIGRLSPQKGFDLALKAFADLHKKFPAARLALIGAGSSEQEYRALAGVMGIKDHVIFTGHRDDVSGFIQAADLFWLTSRNEGMANVMLEAMAHKKAVVAFNVSGVDELVKDGENGFVVEPEDLTSLVDRSETLLLNDHLRELTESNALETVKNNFSREKMLCSLESLFERLLKQV